MATETNLTKLNINRLTKAQYLEADIQGQIDPNEIYILKDALYDNRIIIDDSNLSTETTYSSNKIDNTYLKKAGGTINGALTAVAIPGRQDSTITTYNGAIKVSSDPNETLENGEYLNYTTRIRPRRIEFIHEFGGSSASSVTNTNVWTFGYDDAELSGTKNSFNIKIPNKSGTLALSSDVDTKVAELVNSAPSTLDTLKELSDALGGDPNFATTVATQIGNKQDKLTAGTGITITNNVISATGGTGTANIKFRVWG